MFEVPDSFHVNMAFAALQDSVAGTEGLTTAQEYMFAVLSIEDLPHAQKVAGCESLFSQMKDGVKKVWDYIVKMLKGLKDFLFGGRAKKDIAEAEKKVTENKNNMGSEFDEKTADNLKTRQGRLKASFERYVSRTQGRVEEQKNSKGEESKSSKLLAGLRVEFKHSVETMTGVIKGLCDQPITSASAAKDAQGKILTLLKCMESDEEMVGRHKQAFENAVSDFEKKMNATEDELDKMVMDFELKALRGMTDIFVRIADHLKNAIVDATRLSDALKIITKS